TGCRSTTSWRRWNLRCSLSTLSTIKTVPGRKTDVKDAELDRRSVAAWSHAGKLHPEPRAARTARAGALPSNRVAAARTASKPNPEGPGRGEHQARRRCE